MYEEMNLPVPDLGGYLARLGLDGAAPAGLDGLNELIYRHHTHVPFEDLDVSWLRRPVALDIPSLYRKIVEKRRGGYCYELNALFTRLLLDLGYDVRSVFCRIVRGRDFLPPSAHRAAVVALDGGLYFCDVGFGGPMPAGALWIGDGHAQEIRGEAFRVKRFDEYWWTVARRTSAGDWEDILQFNTFPQISQEFLAANMRSEKDPSSIFVQMKHVALRTEEGSLSITGDAFTVRDRDGVRTETIADDGRLVEILDRYFGIPAASLA